MTKRDSGIELLRIIAILMVILIHAFLYGGSYEAAVVEGGATEEIYTIIKIALRPAVNIFILISGYFMSESRFDLNKSFSRVRSIYSRIWVYSVLLTVVFLLLGSEYCIPVSSDASTPIYQIVLKGIFPVTSQMWYFITNYIILCILSPFINIVLQSIDKNQYRILLITATLLMSVWLTLINVYPFKFWMSSYTLKSVIDGKSIFSFIYIYIIGGYIRMHSEKRNKHYPLFLLTSFLCVIFNYLLHSYLDPEIGYKTVSMYYSNPFVIGQGVLLLLFFKDLHFYSKAINTIASTTLGVYTIHEYMFTRSLIWEKLFDLGKQKNPNLITVIAVCLLLFIILATIDLCFQKTFDYASKKTKELLHRSR